MAQNALMAVSSGWLHGHSSSATVTTIPTTLTAGSTYIYPDYYPWQPYYYPVHTTSAARPIKLTLAEVECLRKAAKTDEKLKSILQKFTAQIEITVDFR